MLNFTLAPARPQPPINGEPFHEWASPDGSPWTQFYRAGSGYLLRFPELADFEISADGRSIMCRPGPEVTAATFEHLYLNQVLPLALSKLGKLVFHASAVEVAGGALAFVGQSGKGKSTLAACFAADGFRLMTDDGLVVEALASGYQVLASHPSIRLWPDSEEALIVPGAATSPSLPFTSKQRFLAGRDIVFREDPCPLRNVYFLGDGSAGYLTLKPMTGAEALVEWMKHSFLLDVQAQPALASHFDGVARLAELPIHYRLDFPRRFEELPLVRDAIVKHARERRGAL